MEIKKAKGSTPNHVPTVLGVELHLPLYMRIDALENTKAWCSRWCRNIYIKNQFLQAPNKLFGPIGVRNEEGDFVCAYRMKKVKPSFRNLGQRSAC